MSGLNFPNSPLSVHSDSVLYSSGSSEVARGREVGVDSGSGNQDEPHDFASFILPSFTTARVIGAHLSCTFWMLSHRRTIHLAITEVFAVPLVGVQLSTWHHLDSSEVS